MVPMRWRPLALGTADVMCRRAPGCGSRFGKSCSRRTDHTLIKQEAPMPFHVSSPYRLPIILLVCSNLFMTIAWYGHLRFKEVPLTGVILASWGIAFIEYCFAVPANRLGNAVYSAAELKTIQEVITLLVFAGFSLVYLKEPIGWNHLVGFAFISAGAFFIFQKW
jgi:uncharacterized protein (DUF486 family)